MGLIDWLKNRWASYRSAADLPRYAAAISGDEIHIHRPDGTTDAIDLNYLRKVIVMTNDSGPWDYDVWFILEGSKSKVEFPLETNGLEEVLNVLRKLEGFELRGMNSAENASFECWPNPS